MDNKVDTTFYERADVTLVARQLLGKTLCTQLGDKRTGGIIVETEAYCGATDSACHAFPDKHTARTSVMYEKGGIAYIYLVYGMHHLFNIVTNSKGNADAVLIRAIEPLIGLKLMQERRGLLVNNKLLTGGPARLTQALGISVGHNKTNLLGDSIWLEEGVKISSKNIARSKRIGVEYAGKDADLLWRYYIKGNKYVSK